MLFTVGDFGVGCSDVFTVRVTYFVVGLHAFLFVDV